MRLRLTIGGINLIDVGHDEDLPELPGLNVEPRPAYEPCDVCEMEAVGYIRSNDGTRLLVRECSVCGDRFQTNITQQQWMKR